MCYKIRYAYPAAPLVGWMVCPGAALPALSRGQTSGRLPSHPRFAMMRPGFGGALAGPSHIVSFRPSLGLTAWWAVGLRTCGDAESRSVVQCRMLGLCLPVPLPFGSRQKQRKPTVPQPKTGKTVPSTYSGFRKKWKAPSPHPTSRVLPPKQQRQTSHVASTMWCITARARATLSTAATVRSGLGASRGTTTSRASWWDRDKETVGGGRQGERERWRGLGEAGVNGLFVCILHVP